ncbi:TetR/AcrR family transcriptional regulator [Gracilimonas mengyeensis]|uniref:Transcriptional regulator, TetR family n=1 Tax=Gracilimonas mengyeensis TaxID=1302730 RepID=A0A521F548_9BACT|nr:TetR/AcrR family transcriptional regulator [Gracilimonas mengyeensis]SMO91295.1 transcriptional regulator, TetR family [Gracilimonas mengyeensis]
MGIKERKERERKRRKDQILTAAIELIEEQGFEKTTMDEIADRAELSKGTLYLYFNDKATLHQAIKKRGLNHIHENFLQIIRQDLPGSELVTQMVLVFLKTITHNATFTKAMFIYEHLNEQEIEPQSVAEKCKNIQGDILMLLVHAIQIGIQDGSIKTSVSPKVLALNISFQMKGMLQSKLAGSHAYVEKVLEENKLTMSELMELFLQTQFNYSATS